MTKQAKRSKASEILWLAVAAMCLGTAIHKTIFVSFSSSWYFYVFVLVALFMYMIRRAGRKQKN